MSISNGKPRTLSARHLDKLRRGSGLTDETIRLASVYTESDPAYVSGLLGWEYPAKALGQCLVFPYPDLDGNPSTYSRVRPDCPRPDGGKYESPANRPNRVYLPPLARAAAKDVSVELLITEGELKALAADQCGFACVGLVGCWGWVKKREDGDEERELNPDLQAFEWNGRKVKIVFDSDAVYKDMPRLSEWELAKLLAGLGAMVKVVRIPAKLGGPKVGLDDYLVAKGVAAFEKLLNGAGPASIPPIGFTNTILRPKESKPTETVEIPRSPVEMAAELVGRSGGWPRCVGGVLVVPDYAGGVRHLNGPNQLFAYAGGVFDRNGASGVTWNKLPGCATKQEFHEYLVAECERFERADELPHVPPIPGVLYTNPAPVPDGKYEALGKFLDFFSPATDEDASLLLACLLTPLWGGPPGRRPAFLFEGSEDDAEGGRGVGKSSVAHKIARLYGGAFDVDAQETFPRTRSRLLTPQAGSYRVLLMDNVKTFRLSSADLESLVTSPNINGHRLYHGQAGVPNYYTLFLTLNGASLSKDFAQRVVPIRFTRAKYRTGWEAEVDAFLDTSGQHLLADLIGVMSRPAVKLASVTRWGLWESEVLARVENPSRCMKLIEQRTSEMDADREDGDRIRETFAEVLKDVACTHASSKVRFLLTSAATTQLVERALNERLTAARASAQIKALGIPELRKSNRNGQRLWLWQGADWVAPEAQVAVQTISFDPTMERWALDEPIR